MPEATSKPKKEATSIKVDPELWKAAKIEAIKRDMELGELVEASLKKELKSSKKTIETKESGE